LDIDKIYFSLYIYSVIIFTIIKTATEIEE